MFAIYVQIVRKPKVRWLIDFTLLLPSSRAPLVTRILLRVRIPSRCVRTVYDMVSIGASREWRGRLSHWRRWAVA